MLVTVSGIEMDTSATQFWNTLEPLFDDYKVNIDICKITSTIPMYVTALDNIIPQGLEPQSEQQP